MVRVIANAQIKSLCLRRLEIFDIVANFISGSLLSCGRMPRFTFRFGEFKGDETLPPLRALRETTERKGIYGRSGDQKGAYRTYSGQDYLYIDFAKEVPENIMTIKDGDFIEQEISRARRMQFLLFRDGTYAYESRRGIYDSDVFEYLLNDFDISYELQRYEQLGLDAMRSFYKDSNIVKKLKAEEIGKHEPNPHVTDEEVRELTEDFGQHSRSFVASVGRTKENLKLAKIIEDGLAKYSHLSMVKSENYDGALRKLRDSGRFDFGVDSDKSEEEQAEEVRDTVASVIRSVFSQSSENNNGEDS